MALLGPFGPRRRVAVAVSGGADSTALALLAAGWGRVLGLVVDHGLRPESTTEARETVERLGTRGIDAQVLNLRGLVGGPGMQARARAARYAALGDACVSSGIVDLLLGHHAADQVETVAMRLEAGSGPAGLAGMAALRVAGSVRLLRPLLAVRPERLRATLRAAGMAWVEDPTNTDLRFTRVRLRSTVADTPVRHLRNGQARQEAEDGDWPATVAVHPAGFAVLPGGAPDVRALAAAVWTVSGRSFPPARDSVRRATGAGTLHGTRIVPHRGRRFVVREEAAMAPRMPARPGGWWDGRFRIDQVPRDDLQLGTLGDGAAGLRGASDLPAAVLRTLPALWRNNVLWAVPHLAYPSTMACNSVRILFRPARPLSGSPFVPAPDASGVHLPAGLPMFDCDGGAPGFDVGFGPRRTGTVIA